MEPLEKLKQMTAWDVEPALTEDDLAGLLAAAALQDINGLAPTNEENGLANEEWSPTYDLNAAAVAGWLIKAGRASTLVEVGPPESGIVTSKVFDNCRAMARVYAAKRKGSVAIR